MRTRTGEVEVKAGVRAVVVDGRLDGVYVVSQAEIAGVEDTEGSGTRKWTGLDLPPIGPVFNDVDPAVTNAAADQTLTHAFAESDDAIGPATGVVESRAQGPSQPGMTIQYAEIDSDIGVDIHLPYEMAGAGDGFDEASENAERGGCSQREYEIGLGAAQAVPEGAEEERSVRANTGEETATEAEVRSADDFNVGRFEGIRRGVRTSPADGADGVTAVSEAAGEVREEPAGGGGVWVEELIQEENTH